MTPGQRRRTAVDDEESVGVLLREMLDQWIERPSADIDPALDAAAQCFARHGLAHTSIAEIAREMGVSKATIYRKVGSMDEVIRLLVARELHDLADELDAALTGVGGVDAVVRLAVTVTRHASDDPLVQKLLADEPHIMGELLPNLAMLIAATSSVLRPYLAASMQSGDIRSSDPTVLAELIVRLAVVAVFSPPPNLTSSFRAALLPHLEPR